MSSIDNQNSVTDAASSQAPTVRDILHSAYTFVRSVEQNKASGSLTLDHFIQDQISALKSGDQQSFLDATGSDSFRKVSRRDQLTNLKKQVDQLAQSISSAGGDEAALANLGLDSTDQPTPDASSPSVTANQG